MATQSGSIKIINAALDVHGDDIILRGLIDPESLYLIQTDEYQREVLSGVKFDGLVKAFQTGKKVQDVTLGMRGHRVREHAEEHTYYLQDPVFSVDGLQRISAAIAAMHEKPDTEVRLGAMIYFGTTQEWEKEQFVILNLHRTKVSPNVILRNMRDTYTVIGTLYSMSSGDKVFVLNDRVCWTQRMRRSDAINALTMLKTIGFLHSHIGPGRGSSIKDLVEGIQQIMERVGKNIFRENTRYFFEIVDICWGIRHASYGGSTQLRGSFLRCLAQMFSSHNKIFFKENHRLMVDADTRKKLKSFPIGDQNIMNLASASGKSAEILYYMLIDHVNRGRRTKRLVEVGRPAPPDSGDSRSEEDEANGDEEGEE